MECDIEEITKLINRYRELKEANGYLEMMEQDKYILMDINNNDIEMNEIEQALKDVQITCTGEELLKLCL